MKTIKLYHGSTIPSIEIQDNAKMSNAANGLGFYMTDSIEVARDYGSNVTCFELDIDIPMIIRPLHEGSDIMEYVVTTQAALNLLILENSDCYEV